MATVTDAEGNGLICFTNCFLPLEDGTLSEKDLWIDAEGGVILDAQKTFYASRKRPAKIVDLEGNILSPGFLDIQINGAYGFDFSIYDGDDEAYLNGLKMVSERIVETGVTSLLPTIITQERSLYPKLLKLLQPHAFPSSATLLGWHAEGPFLQLAKRGAHAPPLIINTAPNGIDSFEEVYGKENLEKGKEGVRVITAAPELEGVMDAVSKLSERGVVFSVGHSMASSKIATNAVLHGARLITHLFNAMPQLHHRDPSIIGLLGAGGPYSTRPIPPSRTPRSRASKTPARMPSTSSLTQLRLDTHGSEALSLSELSGSSVTPPETPYLLSPVLGPIKGKELKERLGKTGMRMAEGDEFERPFYGLIVDGIHSHPNSVRLAYTSHPEGCILVTDAMSMLDPNLPDGVHDWRDGKRLVKTGDRLFIEGTDTLAGSVVTLDSCIRNFSLFTSVPLSRAILCATYNPAKCLGIENKKGTLRAGADADLTILDVRDGSVLSTWVKGREVWKRED